MHEKTFLWLKDNTLKHLKLGSSSQFAQHIFSWFLLVMIILDVRVVWFLTSKRERVCSNKKNLNSLIMTCWKRGCHPWWSPTVDCHCTTLNFFCEYTSIFKMAMYILHHPIFVNHPPRHILCMWKAIWQQTYFWSSSASVFSPLTWRRKAASG